MYDTIIRSALVIDGTGKSGKVLDVGIEGDEVADIAVKIPVKGRSEVMGKGLVLTPGFIDIQNHSDTYWNLIDNPSLDSLVLQGFTSILVGQCGSSLAPLLSREALRSSQKWHDLSGANSDWVSFGEFAHALGKKELGLNVASLVGYSTLRRGLVGDENRKLEAKEVDVLLVTLERALREGALGLSSGLSYAHEASVSELELFEMAKLVKSYDGLLSVHLRSEGEFLLESIEEVLEVARRAEVRMKISHFKARQKENWHLQELALEMLENAVHRGVDVMFDVYPFTSTWQPLYMYLPAWVKSGGRKEMLARIADPVTKKKILGDLREQASLLAGLEVASTSFPMHISGRSMAKIAVNFEMTVEEAVLKVIEHGGSEVLVFDQSVDKANMHILLSHPLGVIASDGGGFSAQPGNLDARHGDKLVHPRCFGTTGEYLEQVRTEGKLSLESAITKLSSEPARLAGLYNRGSIEMGKVADLVLFSSEKIKNRATLASPYMSPEGIEGVWVNGVQVVKTGRKTGKNPGNFLTKVKDD